MKEPHHNLTQSTLEPAPRYPRSSFPVHGQTERPLQRCVELQGYFREFFPFLGLRRPLAAKCAWRESCFEPSKKPRIRRMAFNHDRSVSCCSLQAPALRPNGSTLLLHAFLLQLRCILILFLQSPRACVCSSRGRLVGLPPFSCVRQTPTDAGLQPPDTGPPDASNWQWIE